MTEQYPDGYLEGMQKLRLLVPRKGDPEELAAALIFLASDAGGYVTGITLPVDGGDELDVSRSTSALPTSTPSPIRFTRLG